jgi:type IV secretory pathway component VirB8
MKAEQATDDLPEVGLTQQQQAALIEHLQGRMDRTCRRTTWMASGSMVFCGVAVVVAYLCFKPIPVGFEVVDGTVNVHTRLDIDRMTQEEAMDRADLKRYIEARYRYLWWFAEEDRQLVSRLSTEQVFTVYDRQLRGDKAAGEEGLIRKYGDKLRRKVKVAQPRLLGPNGSGYRVAEVAITVSDTWLDGRPATDQPKPERYLVRIKYTRELKMRLRQDERDDNPFGFLVHAEQADLDYSDGSAAIRTARSPQ